MTTPQEMLGFVQDVQAVRKAQELYRATLNPRLKNELPMLCAQLDANAARMAATLMLDVAEAERDAAEREHDVTAMPKCPKCGAEMVGGAPHGPWPIQYECHVCGTVVVPSSSMRAAIGVRGLIEDLAGIALDQPPNTPELVGLIVRARQFAGSISSATADVLRERQVLDVMATAADPSAYAPKVAVKAPQAREGGAS